MKAGRLLTVVSVLLAASFSKACKEWDNCVSDNKCCPSGTKCYEANQWYAQCRTTCGVSGWTCKVLASSSSSTSSSTSSSKTPSPPAPTPPSSSSNGNTVKLEGFAAMNGGTTGGGSGRTVTVKTLADLVAAAKSSDAMVIVVSGTIDTGSSPVNIASHKTIMGADKKATVKGGFSMNGVKNIILRNLRIVGKGKNQSPADTIAARTSTNLWFDHLEVSDASDGLLDITVKSSYVTVSYCKFYYTDKANDHRLASLNGSGGGTQPEDWGTLKVTYHHNWWGSLVDQRMPRVMYGMGHSYNNYFTAAGNSYCIGVGSYGAALIENNYFKGVNNPHQFMYDVYTHITARGNVYDSTKGKKDSGRGGSRKISGQNFDVVAFDKAPYSYSLDEAKAVPSVVEKFAGPQ